MSQTEPPHTSTEAPPDDGPGPADAFRAAMGQINELAEYAAHYVSAKADAAKATARREVLNVLLLLVAGMIAAAILITSAVLLCIGFAQGLGILFGHRPWLGFLVFGLVILIAAGIGMLVGRSILMERWRQAAVEKYDKRREQQRQRFGRDVRDAGRVERV